MTISSTDVTSGPYSGNDITVDFSYDFLIQNSSDLSVWLTDSNGNRQLQVLDSDYSVSGVGDPNGGLVTFGTAPATGETVYIRGNYQNTQGTDLESQGGFFPSVHEAAFDKLTLLVQEIQDEVSRCIRMNTNYSAGILDVLSETVTNRVGKIIQFDSGGDPVLINASDIVSGLPDDSVIMSSVATLQANTDTTLTKVFTLGVATPMDGGHGWWYFDTSDTTTVDDLGFNVVDSQAVRAGTWKRLYNEPTDPKWFGAVGDAKIWSGGNLVENATPTDDTAALQAYFAAVNYKDIHLPDWYAIYPTTSGNSRDLGVIPDGFIRPGFTYVVSATSGSVTYNSTAYTNGQTFTGVFNHEDWSATGDAVPLLRIPVGLEIDRSGESDSDGQPIQIDGNGGLIVWEDGCGLAIYGDNVAGNQVYEAEIKELRIVRSINLAADAGYTIGLYTERLTFAGMAQRITSLANDINVVLNQCWNFHTDHFYLGGGGITDVSLMNINANSQSINHIFTHNNRFGCVVQFTSAHSASVSQTLRVAFDSTYYWSGTITEVVDATTVVCRDISRTTGTTVGVWQGDIDSGADIDVKDAYGVGGIGMLISNPDGVEVYGDFQNSGEAGTKLLVDGSAGNIGMKLHGHAEGSINGVVVTPAVNAVSPSFSGFFSDMNCYSGRTSSKSNFGRNHAYWLKNVDDGEIDSVNLQTRDNAGITDWAASTAYALNDIRRVPWGYYICTTAGTSAASGVGPTGTGTGIADGTAAWDFMRYPNSCILIESDCTNVKIGDQITYDHNVGAFSVVNLQDQGGNSYRGINIPNGSRVDLVDTNGITATGSQTTIQVDKLSDVRYPKAVYLQVEMDVNSFTGATSAFDIWFRAENGSTNSRVFKGVNNPQVKFYFWQIWVPCDVYGQIRYLYTVTGTIDVDLKISQIGAIY